MSVAFLFEGQGSQKEGMLHSLPSDPIVKKTVEEAESVLKADVMALDTAEALAATSGVQLSLLIYEVSVTRLLAAADITPDFVAGHSLGAFSAAVASGALDFSEALEVVELRGRLMQDAFPFGYGMGAIVGLDESRVDALLKKANTSTSKVYISNINARDQITVSGKIADIQNVFSLAQAAGASGTKFIKISVPSHCVLLNSVSEEIAKKLAQINMNPPAAPYVGAYKARVLKTAAEISRDLSLGLANSVHWYDATTHMYERGVRLFAEIGPGDVLTNLAAHSFRDARCISVALSGLESAALLINNYMAAKI